MNLLTLILLGNCLCGSLGHGVHHRQAMKNRPIKLNYLESYPWEFYPKTSIRQIFAWDVEQDPDTEIDNTLYKIRGYVRLAKLSTDDCDIHMEIGDSPSGTKDRFIVEIPNTKEYCALRESLQVHIGKVGSSPRRFTPGIPITVTGYAFLDDAHYSAKYPKVGHNHGSKDVMTLWEIHPVIQIDWTK